MDYPNMLIIVCGKPGSGKSTYASVLASEKQAVLLDLDEFSEPIVRAGLKASGQNPDDRDSPVYKKLFREPVYQAMFDTAKLNLRHLPVVIVGPFSREIEQSDWHEKLQEQLGCTVEIHYIFCDENTRRERIKARANPRDVPKLQAWDAHGAYYKAQFPACRHLAISTDN